jgi:D-amino-acid oxidase
VTRRAAELGRRGSDAGRRVLVIGGGVSGLSCGVRLCEAGYEVELWTRDPVHATTSRIAAAIWYPYHAGPPERVARWALASLRVFEELARDPASGVRLREGLELLPAGVPDQSWLASLPHRAATAQELARHPGFPRGWTYRVPVVEMPIYLGWLEHRFHTLGGSIRLRAIGSLDEAFEHSNLVVHCSGLGARELADDAEIHPIRGQIVRVPRSQVERFVLDDHGAGGISYVVPRSDDCVLGGSAEEGSTNLEPDPATTAAILARCRALEPRLAHAEVLEVLVGLRPGRKTVRLEAESPRPSTLLVHDYGHGGAGVTLSWGCADEVLELVRERAPAVGSDARADRRSR